MSTSSRRSPRQRVESIRLREPGIARRGGPPRRRGRDQGTRRRNESRRPDEARRRDTLLARRREAAARIGHCRDSATAGIRVGAGARNSEIAAHRLVRERYPAVAEALLAGASGQLRNAATAGGNVLQRTRCLYFQDVAKPCNRRTPGTGCSALEGEQRHLAILGASEHCVATSPSDFAVALAAFDAVVETTERRLPLRELYRLPGEEPHRETVLERGELITALELPPLTARSRFRKVRDRASFAFALVSVAAVVESDGSVRLALGGVAARPWRATRAEEALRGVPLERDTIRAAMETELAEARPLPGTAFKTTLAVRTATATLLELAMTALRRGRSVQTSSAHDARAKARGRRSSPTTCPSRVSPTLPCVQSRSHAGRSRRSTRAARSLSRACWRCIWYENAPRLTRTAAGSCSCSRSRRSPTAGRSWRRSWPRRSRSRSRRGSTSRW